MLMRISILLISIVFLFLPQSRNYRLVVKVNSLQSLKGDLYITLNNKPDYFYQSDSALMKRIVKIDSENQVVIFNKVPAGRYAVAVYHDENLNGKMDANLLGIPREGYGFSNNPKVFGKPDFEEAAFDFRRNDTIVINLIYPKDADKKKDSENK
jgi:uncharacterized protein (DUF2141 family)